MPAAAFWRFVAAWRRLGDMFKFLLGVAFGAGGYWAWQSFGRDLLGLGSDQDTYGGYNSSNTSFNSGTSSSSFGSASSSSMGSSSSTPSTSSAGSSETSSGGTT